MLRQSGLRHAWLSFRPCIPAQAFWVVILWLSWVVGAVGSGQTADAAGAARPNVVIFLVDDMGVMDTSVPFLTDMAGNPVRHPLNSFYRTPQMERLASRGIRFSQFYANSVCSPTRVSLMTGQYAARHRVTNWINPDRNNGGDRAPPEWKWEGLGEGDFTLARFLQAHGYRTIHVGKGHFGPRNSVAEDPRRLGFDVNIGGASFGSPGSYYGKDHYGAASGRRAYAVPGLDAYHGTDTHLTEALTREALDEVEKSVQAGQPFFLYLAHYAVHAPFQSDPRFAAHYRESGKPAAAQAFATLIEGIDKSLGDLLDRLEALQVADKTLIFFLGDNGSDAPLGEAHDWASAAPLRGKKGSHYEGGMRVPFIAAWAQPRSDQPLQQRLPIKAGALQRQVACVCDLLPTIAQLLDISLPENHAVDGQPLQQLLTGEPDPNRKEVFLMHYPHAPHRSDYWTSYREGPWKVIYHYFPGPASEGSHFQLFNLDEDPFEKNDLSKSRPEELRRMMAAMIHLMDQCQAVYPVADDGQSRVRPTLP